METTHHLTFGCSNLVRCYEESRLLSINSMEGDESKTYVVSCERTRRVDMIEREGCSISEKRGGRVQLATEK